MNGLHFIFDFETLGTNILKPIPVLECSYVIFDANRFISNPYTFDELISELIQKNKFNVEYQVKDYGYKIEDDTLIWWKNQDKKLVEKILKPSAADIHIETFVENVLTYIGNKNIKYWWCRSATFDPVIMWRLCTDVKKLPEFHTKLKHWNLRDTRTYIDAKLDFKPDMTSFILKEWEDKFEKHNSAHDIAADILRLQKLVMMENSDD